jgi:hypothetical protein
MAALADGGGTGKEGEKGEVSMKAVESSPNRWMERVGEFVAALRADKKRDGPDARFAFDMAVCSQKLACGSHGLQCGSPRDYPSDAAFADAIRRAAQLQVEHVRRYFREEVLDMARGPVYAIHVVVGGRAGNGSVIVNDAHLCGEASITALRDAAADLAGVFEIEARAAGPERFRELNLSWTGTEGRPDPVLCTPSDPHTTLKEYDRFISAIVPVLHATSYGCEPPDVAPVAFGRLLTVLLRARSEFPLIPLT